MRELAQKIVVIFGPTATGKTDLAIKLCQRFGGEIISVDSRQAYKEMEVGTGKNFQISITNFQTDTQTQAANPREVLIHLYDVATPDQQLNAYEFAQMAWEKIRDICSRGKVPFLVGGTGFYLEVILGFRPLSGFGADRELRVELEGLSTEQLVERLMTLDLERARMIDVKNKYRLIRAIELTSARSGILQGLALQRPLQRPGLREDFGYLLVGLTAENSRLYEMADGRIDRMMEQGLLEEVRRLVKKYGWATPGLKTLGYREFQPYFQDGISLPEVTQRIKFNTHSYIRRQKTYFKKYFASASWFDISQPGFEKEAEKEVKLFLMGRQPIL